MISLRRRKFSVRQARFCVLLIILAGVLFLCRDRGISGGASDVGAVSGESSEMFSETEWNDFRGYGERLLAETLDAYNQGNYENFIKNFSLKRRAMTKRAFEALWEVDYKGKYGNFISHEFFKEKSNQIKNFPLLAYKAVFSKNGEIGVRCVFTRDDDGVYRIFYLRFDPFQDLFY